MIKRLLCFHAPKLGQPRLTKFVHPCPGKPSVDEARSAYGRWGYVKEKGPRPLPFSRPVLATALSLVRHFRHSAP
jgi:hypothetical protein